MTAQFWGMSRFRAISAADHKKGIMTEQYHNPGIFLAAISTTPCKNEFEPIQRPETRRYWTNQAEGHFALF
jgi:hypothetical protein